MNTLLSFEYSMYFYLFLLTFRNHWRGFITKYAVHVAIWNICGLYIWCFKMKLQSTSLMQRKFAVIWCLECLLNPVVEIFMTWVAFKLSQTFFSKINFYSRKMVFFEKRNTFTLQNQEQSYALLKPFFPILHIENDVFWFLGYMLVLFVAKITNILPKACFRCESKRCKLIEVPKHYNMI